MSLRLLWDRYEIALLFRAYERISNGNDANVVVASLSKSLRNLAIRRGVVIDAAFRNVNGIRLQLANVQYLCTDGAKGLYGASSLMREMFQLYKLSQAEFQEILRKALQMIGEKVSVEDAFFAYAKDKTNFSPSMLAHYLEKTADYCGLKQPLLGMTDIATVEHVQKKIAGGRFLRFRFWKDTQAIRNVTELYYNFIKDYHNKSFQSVTEKTAAYMPLLKGENVNFDEQRQRKTSSTIKDTVVTVLRNTSFPMSAPEILEQIFVRKLYRFNTENPLSMVQRAIRQNCEGARLSRNKKSFRLVLDNNGKRKYMLADSSVQNVEKQTKSMNENIFVPTRIRDNILSFVSDTFPNGIRPASIIDVNKLKRVYQIKFNEEIPPEVDIVTLLMSEGLVNGEKVYFLTDNQKQSIHNLISGIVESGHRVIYYNELLSLHSELFETCHIYEISLMQIVLRNLMNAYIYKNDCMFADRNANETEEIVRAFGENVVLTYQQLKNRCPYLTFDAIKKVLSRSDRFVWSSPETYAQADLINLDQSEVSDIINHILPMIQTGRYFSLAQLPIEESCGMNPQVSSSAIRDVIYNRYMADQFTRKGLIVKIPGIHISTYQVMGAWLKGLDQATLIEIEDYERELTGRYTALGVLTASNFMVRVDHDHYVSDASIQFDVDAVDRAIALFAGNRIIPITAITSFTSFPDVSGYTWNLYIVESFLRRFSKRFTIDGGPAQVSYVGGICSVEQSFENYEDRLAHAVIQDGVALTEDAVGNYLLQNKFILRRTETVRKTFERAKILNEQRSDANVRI